MNWEPIATAPKNRKVLVHYLNPLGNSRIVMACCYGEKCLPMDFDDDEGGIYDEDSGETFAPAGWYEEHEHDDPLRPVDGEPTHWHPLPAPPIQGAASTTRAPE